MFIPRHHKTYLSRAMTRAMATDHPIGDPHGGPAYGERNDPISAIASIGSMFAATSGFTLGLGAMSLAQGLMFAGGAMGLLGGITGNKTLSRLGMVAGLAGGIGQLAGIGTETTVGSLFGGGGEAAAGVAVNPTDMRLAAGTQGAPMEAGIAENILADSPPGLAGGVQTSPVAPQPSLASQSLTQGPSFQTFGDGSSLAFGGDGGITGMSPATDPGMASASKGIIGDALSPPTVTPPSVGAPTVDMGINPTDMRLAAGTQASPLAPPAPTVSAGATPPTTSPVNPAVNPTDMRLAAGTQATPMAAPAKSFLSNIGTGFMELTKTNPGAAMVLASTVGGAMDVLSGKAGAQIDALEAQGELSKAQADKIRFEMEEYKRKQRNISEGYRTVQNPFATWRPPTPQGAQPAPPAGLVAGAMAPA